MIQTENHQRMIEDNKRVIDVVRENILDVAVHIRGTYTYIQYFTLYIIR
jgi:hypothetical protein